ncbi:MULTISPECIES: acetylornithine deacetylase [Methylococcus]|uniref:Acetylornithine deacetylase n=1 Tax=Methylococcus capsulatus TaxID=414 RepID=A0ABZ2F6I6_METCP|nr:MULTISPECIES: acetylornithine deacetylase [Methylococcus]MDF9392483.1 acetylornithine deacetylase [Methylococcus capsulatus]
MARHLPPLREMIRALIARPSVSCTDPRFDESNRAVIDLLAEWAEALGFRVAIQPLAHGKANLIASLGPAECGGGLALSGHTDTVPCDPDRWHSDPFMAIEKDGRIYGLGSADMKSFFALALTAASDIDPAALHRPLLLVATADEESSMAGAKALLPVQLAPARRCVIGEPTGLKPIRMHKGVMMESIRVRGQAGHSSDPTLGANAIEGMHRLISELLVIREELQERYRNPAFAVPVPTLNLGAIRGGDNPNRICGQCELSIDLRPLPGMDTEELRNLLKQRLARALPASPRFELSVDSLFDGVPAFETRADAGLVRCCEHLSHARAGAVSFGTEAPFFSRLGMETVVLGAGYIEQAHQPDEYLPLDHIEPATAILRGLIERYCIRPVPAPLTEDASG